MHFAKRGGSFGFLALKFLRGAPGGLETRDFLLLMDGE
tara:strand:- start:111 stop:224 length:114 start_codon:yes stop_codon:yes gene_type:complete